MKEINKNTEMTIEDKVIEWKKEYKKVFLSTKMMKIIFGEELKEKNIVI